MSTMKKKTLAGAAATLLVGGVLLAVAGCAPSSRSAAKSTLDLDRLAQAETSGKIYYYPALDDKAKKAEEADEGRSGAQIWATSCKRCHNIRSPSSLSDDQWEIVVNHMRIIAGLTADDSRKIVKFLKAAN